MLTNVLPVERGSRRETASPSPLRWLRGAATTTAGRPDADAERALAKDVTRDDRCVVRDRRPDVELAPVQDVVASG